MKGENKERTMLDHVLKKKERNISKEEREQYKTTCWRKGKRKTKERAEKKKKIHDHVLKKKKNRIKERKTRPRVKESIKNTNTMMREKYKLRVGKGWKCNIFSLNVLVTLLFFRSVKSDFEPDCPRFYPRCVGDCFGHTVRKWFYREIHRFIFKSLLENVLLK